MKYLLKIILALSIGSAAFTVSDSHAKKNSMKASKPGSKKKKKSFKAKKTAKKASKKPAKTKLAKTGSHPLKKTNRHAQKHARKSARHSAKPAKKSGRPTETLPVEKLSENQSLTIEPVNPNAADRAPATTAPGGAAAPDAMGNEVMPAIEGEDLDESSGPHGADDDAPEFGSEP